MQKPCGLAPTAAWTRNLRSRHPASGGGWPRQHASGSCLDERRDTPYRCDYVYLRARLASGTPCQGVVSGASANRMAIEDAVAPDRRDAARRAGQALGEHAGVKARVLARIRITSSL